MREVRESSDQRESSANGQTPRRRRQPVLHPLLFAAFPVLFLYAHNIQEGVSVGDLLRPLGLAVGESAGLFAIGLFLLRDLRKAGLAVSALVLLFFSYGRVYLALKGWRVAGILMGGNVVLGALWGLLAVAAVAASIRARKRLYELTTILNVVAAGLVLINVASVLQYQVRSKAAERAAIRQSDASFQGHLPDPDEIRRSAAAVGRRNTRPDIYYIMLEEYGGEDGLREVFGYDNTPFLRALQKRGFYVGHKTTTNYPRSELSLASSLNMEYLHFLTAELGKNTNDIRPLTRLIQHNRVARYLKSIGYRYIHIGSWWEPTKVNPIADENVIFGGPSEFDQVLSETTGLQPIGQDQWRRREWKRVQFEFTAVERTKTIRSRKFVFAHILVPHEPYVFYPSGRYKTEEDVDGMTREENYIQQLKYANSSVLRMLDKLLSGSEGKAPVIVLQSDEGPYQGAPNVWKTISDPTLIRKFPILNAYYLPGATQADLYPLITPVNSFRVVFRLYLGADLATLPDRNYVFLSLRHLYDFIDVTGQVRALLSG